MAAHARQASGAVSIVSIIIHNCAPIASDTGSNETSIRSRGTRKQETSMHHCRRPERQQGEMAISQRRMRWCPTGIATTAMLTIIALVKVPNGSAFYSTSRALSTRIVETGTEHRIGNGLRRQRLFSSSSGSPDVDLLNELPLVPKEVLGKFLQAVGQPLTAASLQQGYQAGVVSETELNEIRQRLPGMADGDLPEAMPEDTIAAHWSAALQNQPWHIQSMGKLAGPTIVPLVRKMQEKAVRQAAAMKWINDQALREIRGSSEVVQLLSEGAAENGRLALNNTRARFEPERGVWSASMDVFLVKDDGAVSTDGEKIRAEENPDLAIRNDGDSDDGDNDEGNDLDSMVTEVRRERVVDTVNAFVTDTPPIPQAANDQRGLVNAYFVPDKEIRILVVEIDEVLHNVTWKGLERTTPFLESSY